ncbi:hypothetical protein PHMEG_00028644 [Phytophthora megakarya]|uniref:Uncharacterized protein n=1 Tax=Phytophthora megakarya TaxID=4795 RepID=A0A225V5N6_9STRA|nr:hypothetical protein PHMEG_00028644 [Phytophthora megakarya]
MGQNSIALDETNLTAEQDGGSSQGIQLSTLEPVTAWDYAGAHLRHLEERSHSATTLNEHELWNIWLYLNKEMTDVLFHVLTSY